MGLTDTYFITLDKLYQVLKEIFLLLTLWVLEC